MVPLDGSAHDDRTAPDEAWQLAALEAFTPMTLCDRLGWVRICAPQPRPRAACLAVTAYIHLMRPAFPLRSLDARAEEAIRALETGAASVTVIDDHHRVDRSGPPTATAPAQGTADGAGRMTAPGARPPFPVSRCATSPGGAAAL
jgi:hypothetical protein